MNILICSDGSELAENAVKFAALLAPSGKAAVTLLGVVEKTGDEAPLLDALRREMQFLKDKNIDVELITKNGEPVTEIKKHTARNAYDLVLIGAEYKGRTGPFVMSMKAYKLIKIIEAPVLVVVGKPARLRRMLICSGGRSYIDKAVDLAGWIAAAAGAGITLFHVLPEPPALYANMIEISSDTGGLLASHSALGRNLRHEKDTLEKLGIGVEVKLAHGEVGDRILDEVRSGDYDLIIAGSAPGSGALRTYLMGNVTSEIVNRSQLPVLVVRGIAQNQPAGFWGFLRRLRG